jgi:hypothetical protein
MTKRGPQECVRRRRVSRTDIVRKYRSTKTSLPVITQWTYSFLKLKFMTFMHLTGFDRSHPVVLYQLIVY